ncbi:uncharacterized protein J3D65DRAFT_339385 [Phyllosticta citribraziliensis]|uniref:ATPase synthesis protein 25 n=1 Tax=Phyllosticta citribraziliensis TaxID=989973 RepID=A0ABR1LU19_9PEZI
MAASRALTARFGCNGCRANVLRSFASLPALEWSPKDALSRSLLRSQRHQRTFNAYAARFSDNVPQESQKEISPEPLDPESNDPDSSVPWYLQVDSPQKAVSESPLAQRQKLPELPEHPPPMLETLLEHASVDLGLDDLSLLDLRELDPPPALGANLIMLFGTARSERHLHVAADRLCRWLRSQYKLRAHADGLLGRNELKLRLRRKAKKMRMLANAGASPTSLAADDGIRTDWICVNAGSVEAAPSAPSPLPRQESFIGFREEVRGVTIVFQMFTEEKRVELDLEGLWNGVLKTDRRVKEALQAGDVVEEELPNPEHNPNGAVTTDRVPMTPPSSAASQSRGFHTLCKPRNSGTNPYSRVGTCSRADDQVRIWRKSMSTLGPGPGSVGKLEPPTFTSDDSGVSPTSNLENKRNLKRMLEELRSMSLEKQKLVFSKDITPLSENLSLFLEEFFRHVPLARLDRGYCRSLFHMYATALSVGREDAIGHMLNLLREMQTSGFPVSEGLLVAALRELGKPDDNVSGLTRKARINALVRILSIKEQTVDPGFTEEVFVALHQAFSVPFSKASDSSQSDKKLRRRADRDQATRSSLLQIVERTSLDLQIDTFFLLLETYAQLGDAERLIHVWRTIPLYMLPRSADMYAFFLNAMAKTGTQVQCIESLRECMVQREFEDPPVALGGEVARAAQRCILRIDENLHRKLEKDNRPRYTHNEWVRLWNACEPAQKRSF